MSLKQYEALQRVQLKEFPESIFIDLEIMVLVMKLYPADNIIDGRAILKETLKGLDNNDMFYMCYVLPPGVSGLPGRCCCGLRYGTEPHEYISLPNLAATAYEE